MVNKVETPAEYGMDKDQLASVIDYGVKLVEEDHIGLGSDFDGGPLLAKQMEDASNYPGVTKALRRLG